MALDEAFWVFGYGSLMWDPGFDFVERRLATLDGYHRAFCLRSIHYRGTATAPGLVLGLDAAPGARCGGVAYRVDPALEGAVLDYLRERELVSYAYHEARVALRSEDPGEVFSAVTYVVDPAHKQYAGRLPLTEQASIIRVASGQRGSNIAYFNNTMAHLREVGIHDEELEALAAILGTTG